MLATTRIGTIIDTPRKRPRQQRSRDTVDAIVEAAAQVFEREGLGATTNRIAERAGVSIGTLYQYFPHKQALLHELAERHVAGAQRSLDAEFARLRAEPPSWAEAVRSLVATLLDLHIARPRLHALMHEYAPRVPEGVARLHALQDSVAEEVEAVLRRYGRGGPDPARTAALLVQAVDAQLHRVVLTGRGDGEDLTRALLAMAGGARDGCDGDHSSGDDQIPGTSRSTSQRLHPGATTEETTMSNPASNPANPADNPAPAAHEYTLTRVLDAPVEKVWAAWTQPEHYAKWSGAVLPSISLDVRPGGAWRATMAIPDGSEFPLTGTYGEVVENRRLETLMDLPGGATSSMVMDLTDLDGKTRIVLSQACATAQERDESREGSGMLLDWLAAYVPTI